MTEIIHRTKDKYSDILVIDADQYRILTFGSKYEQSSMHRENPAVLVHEYMQAMMLALGFITPSRVILLGLGAGCLLRSLHQVVSDCEFIAVELRQAVYDIAKKYFQLPDNQKTTITIANAHNWLKKAAENQACVIFSDLFHSEGMDPMQQQKKFIHHCHRILNKKGWLVINYHKIPEVETDFFQSLCSIFADIFVCPIDSGNNIIFASKTPIKILSQFNSSIIALEKKLAIPLNSYFKKLTRIK